MLLEFLHLCEFKNLFLTSDLQINYDNLFERMWLYKSFGYES